MRDTKLRDSLIAQATACITVAGFALWLVGAMSLTLKLEFHHLGYNILLTQFPQSVVVLTGVTDVLPPSLLIAIVLGGLMSQTCLLRFMSMHTFKALVLVALLAAGAAFLPVAFVGSRREFFRSFWEIRAISFGFNLVFFEAATFGAAYVAKLEKERYVRSAPLVIVYVFALAFPVVAASNAARELPVVAICRSSPDGGSVLDGTGGAVASSSSFTYLLQFTRIVQSENGGKTKDLEAPDLRTVDPTDAIATEANLTPSTVCN